jgi:hypothetical protein
LAAADWAANADIGRGVGSSNVDLVSNSLSAWDLTALQRIQPFELAGPTTAFDPKP